MQLKNRVALVTGSAKRVGKTIALALAKRGANLIIHYKNSKKEAEKTVLEIKKIGRKACALKADLASSQDCLQMVKEALAIFGRIDILVNSASVYEEARFGEIREELWDQHLNTNLKAPFFLSQAVSKGMLKNKSGKIINIIDSDIHKPYKHYLPYLVSKSGMAGLTYCLAKELAPYVQVNGISPGPVLLQKDWGPKIKAAILKVTPLKKIGSPEDIANAVLFCIEGTDFMTGAIIPIDGGQHIE
ncbi:MAG: hypothetical protein A3I11_03565 [Elusimicrobia bacterium RIFCSPLOWO2_02_FULL_39_32]|nr:MAG: hypothetical protein A2034_00255 [Elusimicrobia bacterium GWA2_38_7]OGR79459.1 MAG: hypothetical protein A3B80_02135 [Elusimicrobia bacterium RIFCSPHIGHO2_02_FULL_39_36]OGR92786.1 MAG: hypothetical protein A3I11_03565 [Elusimicrobia bacterium RIFCSPLOWO2_02_FULL_39_32]OGR99571.1 MAG: hypothetical protein A3G85_00920 [Elusimicrobia bacterium RIFCSPLOWO2_12_FULL_39_28]